MPQQFKNDPQGTFSIRSCRSIRNRLQVYSTHKKTHTQKKKCQEKTYSLAVMAHSGVAKTGGRQAAAWKITLDSVTEKMSSPLAFSPPAPLLRHSADTE
jgi:hypothetical protein